MLNRGEPLSRKPRTIPVGFRLPLLFVVMTYIYLSRVGFEPQQQKTMAQACPVVCLTRLLLSAVPGQDTPPSAFPRPILAVFLPWQSCSVGLMSLRRFHGRAYFVPLAVPVSPATLPA